MDNKENNISNDDIEIIDDESVSNEEVEVLEPTPGISNIYPSANPADNSSVTDNSNPSVSNPEVIESISSISQDNVVTLEDNSSSNIVPEVNTFDNNLNNNSIEQNNYNETLEPIEKKKNKILKPLIIVLAIILVIGGGLFAYKEFVLLNKKNIVQNGVFYIFNALDSNVDKFKNKILSFDTSSDAIGMDGTITMSSNYKNDSIDLTKLKDYSFTYNSSYDLKNNKMSMSTNLNKNDTTLLSVASYISGKLGLLESNQLSFYSYRFNLDREIKDFEFNTNNLDDYRKIITKTRDITKNFINEKDISRDSVDTTINGKKANYTRFTYTLNLEKYMYTLLKEYANDDNAINIISKLVGLDATKTKSLLESLTAEELGEGSSKLSFEVYVDSLFGTFKQLVIYNPKNTDTKFTLYSVDNGCKFQFGSKYSSIFGEYINKKFSIYNDNLKISFEELNDNESILSVDFKDSDYNINFTVDMKSNIDNDKKNDKYVVSLNIEKDNNNIEFKINIENNLYKNATVKEMTPFITKDIEEVDEYEIQNMMNKFMEIMDNIIKDIYPSYGLYRNDYYNSYDNYFQNDFNL